MKHLLKLSDLTSDEIGSILELAEKLKQDQKQGIPHKELKGKCLGMVFQKSSTRTRVSFEVGTYQLGGHALFLSSHDTQLGRGEPIEDTARVLSRYLDGIMIRTFAQSDVEKMARWGSVPVINGLTDYAHPCQVLATLQTIKEHKGHLEGLKLTFIGDGNNMANSLIAGITDVINKHGKVIVVEDDLIVSRFFLKYIFDLTNVMGNLGLLFQSILRYPWKVLIKAL